jgi:hypothetical protein
MSKRKDFFITALGETLRGDELIISGVNIAQVAREVLTGKELDRWTQGTRSASIKQRVDRAIAAEFRRIEREQLSPTELEFSRYIHKLQALNGGRFRLYGGILRGRPWINLVTEFNAFIDEKSFWKTLMQIAKSLSAKTYVMHDGPHVDSSGYPAGSPDLEKALQDGRKLKNGGQVENGIVWTTGPDHGRLERQVELSWPVYGKNLREIKTMIRKISKATNDQWEHRGVSVI